MTGSVDQDRLEVPAELIRALEAARRVLVVGHVNPDADCLGAMLAAGATLRDQAGKEAAVVLPPPGVPQKLSFMVDLAAGLSVGQAVVADDDTLLLMDTARASRANVSGDLEAFLAEGRAVLNVDHHVTNTRFGSVNWVEAEASSTSEMIFWLARKMGWAVSPTTATLLFAGLHADTAGFSLSTTTQRALRVAAELVAAGADVARIGERLYRSMRSSEFALARLLYDNTRVTLDGRIAYSTARFEEIDGTGCTGADIDDQVNIPRMIAGVRMALLFTEGQPGKVRVNLRGEGGTSVVEVAQRFGGGGHVNSAGTILKGPFDQVVRQVLEEAARHLDAGPVRPPGEERHDFIS